MPGLVPARAREVCADTGGQPLVRHSAKNRPRRAPAHMQVIAKRRSNPSNSANYFRVCITQSWLHHATAASITHRHKRGADTMMEARSVVARSWPLRVLRRETKRSLQPRCHISAPLRHCPFASLRELPRPPWANHGVGSIPPSNNADKDLVRCNHRCATTTTIEKLGT